MQNGLAIFAAIGIGMFLACVTLVLLVYFLRPKSE